ncbi:hypothetical protein [Rhizobium sp. NFR03]|uniref:hypothetical protein n=1 Tax=Rhizobium sp. NFR03 TaxID=1566263 RepID=UPI0008BBFB8C|nr:hypothetical protein [Rhizobium sp. NFR03]SES05899.1 hypothetical protein SAMN03159406_01976 [Rhizobium sp. NFR03]
MPIITLKDGTRINSAHVLKYQSLANRSTRFLLSDGTVVTGEPYGDPDEKFISTFPANAGFKAVYALPQKDGTFIYIERAVIAWMKAPAGNYPVFQGYEGDALPDYEVIVEPSGKVFDGDGDQFDSLDAWRSFYEEQNPVCESVVAA